MASRTASHANSWYSGDRTQLNSQLDSWLDAVPNEIDGQKLPIPSARLIIAPHAGYSYSGPAAAYAYKSLDLSKAKRVFIIGPSHHVYLDSCALSACQTYETPLGDLPLDTETLKSLHSTNLFQWMRIDVDEEEHSIEMHLPYTYKMIERAGRLGEIKVVPIMVGSISTRKEKAYGEALAEHLKNPENCFIISSDFCHWGTRFSYTHYFTTLPTQAQEIPPSVSLSRSPNALGQHKIYKSIEALDRQGMASIETGSHDTFADYLKTTQNTICGRHPIGVVMAGIETVEKHPTKERGAFKFVRYEQSSQVMRKEDSSVSYASAYAVF